MWFRGLLFFRFAVYDALDVSAYHRNALLVVSSLRYDDMSEALCGFDKLLVHGLENLQITVYNHLYGTSSLDDVALDVSDKALVRVAVHEDAEVHHVAQTLV